MQKDWFFIVVDGIDGSGKGLQTRLLVERLRREGREVLPLSFPCYEETIGGKLLKDLLKSPEFLKTDPRLASLPYALDRWEMKDTIKIFSHRDHVIVSDRYVSANQIHQGGKYRDHHEREAFLNWLDVLEYDYLGVVRPHLCILVDMPVETAISLLQKEGKILDAAEQDVEYLTNSRECVLWLANNKRDRYCDYHIVEAVRGGNLRTPEGIAEEIWGIVQPSI